MYAVADPKSDHEDLAWSIMRNVTRLCYSVSAPRAAPGARRLAHGLSRCWQAGVREGEAACFCRTIRQVQPLRAPTPY